jgi:hypothetical protein
MNWLVGFLIVCLLGFAIGSAVREIRIYRRAVRGDVQFLVSRSRRNRRLLISFFLVIESALLYFGTFQFKLSRPHVALIYWTPALLLMILVMLLAFQDLRETRRDLDRIFREAVQSALKNAKDARKGQ